MLNLILGVIIMSRFASNGEVRLYDEARNCAGGNYVDLVVDNTVTDTGCWTSKQEDTFFLVQWAKSGKLVAYSKAGTVRVTMADNQEQRQLEDIVVVLEPSKR